MGAKWRNIVVDGKRYRWKGRQFFIIQDDKGYRIAGVAAHLIVGCTVESWERAVHKRYGMITPNHIQRYIKSLTKPRQIYDHNTHGHRLGHR